MKGLILAAGRGTRIRSIVGEHPKCLITFDGESIIEHQIESLLAAGVREVGIAVGYKKLEIMRHVEDRFGSSSARIRFLDNPIFESTNNIYSLWLARDWVGGDACVCLNADVAFDPAVLSPLLQSPEPITMLVDPEWRDETMKVIIQNGRIIRMSKLINRSAFSGTYIGITAFAKSIQSRFFQRVGELIRSGYVNIFFNSAVQDLADEGVRVGFVTTNHLPWAEIDDPGDLAYASEHVFPRLRRAIAA
ncbi:MAG TPA: phosphocholine cytidylyltransferase family protein [Candidatus Acidoferrales bacterium]|nr:phosphocholine cytidylyltransferase family protein [Candidatus Acidoferrales bacterium]